MIKPIHKVCKLINRIFKEQHNSDCLENPWAGLSSYEDNTTLKFCGRKNESDDVFNLIDENTVITLYGKSGIGKTSLLNAGVFPILRKNLYHPLYIRFNNSASGKQTTYASQIISKLEEPRGDLSIEIIDVIPENNKEDSDDFLWSFFARRRFLDKNGNTIFPVLVLDQFEENIRVNRQQTTLLLKQIAYMSNRQNMLKDTKIGEFHYVYNFNFRFVISIREDDLYRLEDILITNYISSLRNGRYRLQNLSNEGAQSVIRNIGDGIIDENNVDAISERIISVSRHQEDGLIQTNVISLICARLFDLVISKGKNRITLKDVDSYLSIDPFEEYYTTAVRHLSESEKRFIETSLASTDGRRNVVPEEKVNRAIKSYSSLIKGKTPIFHRILSPSGENFIELIHDGLCSIVLNHKAIRLERKNRTILSLWLLIFGIISLWMLDTAVVNNFVSFFLRILKIEYDFRDVLTLTETCFIFLCPIFLGSIIFDYRKKKIIAALILILFLLPIIAPPRWAFINLIREGLLKIASNYNSDGIRGVLQNISGSTIVYIVYAILTLTLCVINGFSKQRVMRGKDFFAIIKESHPVSLYFLVIVGYLFFRSIFNNTQNVIIEHQDSLWGLLVIPMITLNLFGIKIVNKRVKWALCLFVLILCVLIVLCYNNSPIVGITLCIVISLITLFTIYYEKKISIAVYKAFGSVVILTLVLALHIGYNPFSLGNKNIYQVYPWHSVIYQESNKYGVCDAINGDTIITPLFDSVSKNTFYRELPHNAYINTIKNETSLEIEEYNFPLKLSKDNGEWKLSVDYYPHFEKALRNSDYKNSTDSTLLLDIKAAHLFISLRNDIIKFCIQGDESIFLSDVLGIISYENLLNKNLAKSWVNLVNKGSKMTEADIIPIIKQLSRSLYMNMIKESILKGEYNNLIQLYSQFYPIVLLPEILEKSKIEWESNIKLDVKINSTESKKKTKIPNFGLNDTVSFSLKELNDNKLYAWNNLFYSLFVREFGTYSCFYYANLEKEIEENYKAYEQIVYNQSVIVDNLKKNLHNLEKQNKDLKQISKQLEAILREGNSPDAEDLSQTIKSLIDINNMSQNIRHSVSTEVTSYSSTVDSIAKSIKELELIKADKEFEKFVITSLNETNKIVGSNPLNGYNGLLISLCQEFYIIGVVRGYNMESFINKLDSLDKKNIYLTVREIEDTCKNLRKKFHSIKSQNSVVNQMIRTISQ